MPLPPSPRILILHDYFLYRGGGERVVISLAKHLPATVATAFIAKDAFDPRAEGIPTIELLRESVFSRLPGFRYTQVQWAFLFKTGFLKNYDVIIYSGDCLTALLRAKGKTNIAYLHTPPRHLYDCYRDRLRQYPWWKKILFVPFAAFNRWRFGALARRFDCIVTNSQNVRERTKHYLGLDSAVVYPPCDTLPFQNLGSGDYFFSWARLYDVKRAHLIAEAFTRLPEKKLIIASGGPELARIKNIARGHDNITVLGWISDAELLEYLGHCLATIYIPLREDFGMSPVESMAAGKPVIGVAEGGMREVVEGGVNGLMLRPDFTVDDLVAAVRALTPGRAQAMAAACYATARRFTEAQFIAGLRRVIEETLVKKSGEETSRRR
ncbi:MAG: glycosyltransferase [Candidatus Magasanikbacteria bacterium]|nr:glycosyltransferase [Candidatus Magasanikbacteria bacterium]